MKPRVPGMRGMGTPAIRYPETGRELRRARAVLGLARVELAQMVGAPLHHVMQWEQGRSVPEGGMRQELARALRRPIAVLFPVDRPELSAVYTTSLARSRPPAPTRELVGIVEIAKRLGVYEAEVKGWAGERGTVETRLPAPCAVVLARAAGDVEIHEWRVVEDWARREDLLPEVAPTQPKRDRRGNRYTPEQRKATLQLYAASGSEEQACALFGIHPGTLQIWNLHARHRGPR
ncbi:MAG: hypothetical protein JWN10_1461 [Solirubrobacterales bacterium]|nr:hypothetical protein [Solirubrobacterales bacterium]